MFTFMSQFRNFTLYLDKPDKRVENGQTIYGDPRPIRFTNKLFTTKDSKLAQRLRTHKRHGVSFHEVIESKVPDEAKKPAA